MKVADKVILLLDGGGGLAAAISGGLCPKPKSNLQTINDSFELSLESYGVKDQKASGKSIHFVDSNGCYEVSILILQNYEPPVLACALNEVLLKLAGDNLSKLPTLMIPFILPEPKLKLESKSSMKSDKVSIYGIKLGPTTDKTETLNSKLLKAPPSMQIHNEGLATLLHLINAMKLPTVVLIGVSDRNTSNNAVQEEIEIMGQLGDHLANALSLSYSKGQMSQSPAKASRDDKEAWRALYG